MNLNLTIIISLSNFFYINYDFFKLGLTVDFEKIVVWGQNALHLDGFKNRYHLVPKMYFIEVRIAYFFSIDVKLFKNWVFVSKFNFCILNVGNFKLWIFRGFFNNNFTHFWNVENLFFHKLIFDFEVKWIVKN
jgi:hypothetical protein